MLYVAESYVSRRDNGDSVFLGDCGYQEAFTNSRGALFRECQKEYGRCVSKIYSDADNLSHGWVFEKRQPFEDTPDESSIIETWIHVRSDE